MSDIIIDKVTECSNSDFIKPKRIHYRQKGIKKSWDIVKTHDSVVILLYHITKKSFVLVKQFRPAVYLNNKNGFTYELCAGIVDKDKSLKMIAKEEILEETGYDVKLANIKKITSFYTAVGFSGSKQNLYFAKVDDSLKSHNGGGVDTEDIEVIYLPITKAKEFIFDESIAKAAGLAYSFMWFFENSKMDENLLE